MPDVLADLRRAFPAAEFGVYFNHAAVAPIATPVARAMREFLDECSRHGSAGFADWLALRETARAAAAALVGGDPSEIAFTTSTSQGLLLVAEGLELRPGDRIVVIEDDFPANRIPWERQRRRGAEIVVVARRQGRVPVAALLDAIDERTVLLALPWVLYDNGYRIDLPALGAALRSVNAGRARPVRLCVDAIQGLGAFPLDARACGIDFLSADSHKWMLGLEGIGLFWCRRELVTSLDAPQLSWWSLARPFARWEPGAPWQPDARRWEYACLPTVGLHGLAAALAMLNATGPERMARRILELTGALADGLRERGWELLSPLGAETERSGIVTARRPGGRVEDDLSALARAGVQATPRGGGIRFSPHAWNTLDEVGRVLEALP